MHKIDRSSGRSDSSVKPSIDGLLDRDSGGITGIEGASARLSVFGYLCVCLGAIFFGYLAVTAPSTYHDLIQEDSWVENFTAICLFLSGLFLIVTALVEHRALPLCIYILSGVAFLFAAAEEISWGQRIFGFHTPDYLMDLNRQHELNIHNTRALRPFIQIDYYGTLIFCIMTYAAFFYKKDMILGVPLPSIPLVFSFMVMLSHTNTIYGLEWLTFFISSPEIVLLLLFIICMLFERQIPLVIAAIATMISVLVFSYVYSAERGGDIISPGEFRECLFGFCCLFYSLELLLIRTRQTKAPRYVADPNCTDIDGFRCQFGLERFGLDLGGRFRVPFWLAVSFFVITGSIWLAPLKYFRIKMEDQITKDTVIEETRRLIKYADPIIRSHFDVYLRDNKLLYVKEECNKEDINLKFFLHIEPIDQSALPRLRQQFGFDNLDFFFIEVDGFYDARRCIVVRSLPDYDIASIRTGQYIIKGNETIKGNKTIQIWKGVFTFSPGLLNQKPSK